MSLEFSFFSIITIIKVFQIKISSHGTYYELCQKRTRLSTHFSVILLSDSIVNPILPKDIAGEKKIPLPHIRLVFAQSVPSSQLHQTGYQVYVYLNACSFLVYAGCTGWSTRTRTRWQECRGHVTPFLLYPVGGALKMVEPPWAKSCSRYVPTSLCSSVILSWDIHDGLIVGAGTQCATIRRVWLNADVRVWTSNTDQQWRDRERKE